MLHYLRHKKALGPFLLTWISNYINFEVSDEITYQFPIFKGGSSHTMLGVWLLIHAEVKFYLR